MAFSGAHKKDVLVKWFGSDSDTGSSKAQIALLSGRISMVSKHMDQNKKDFSSKRGLLKLVGERRRLLDYLSKTDSSLYDEMKIKMKV